MRDTPDALLICNEHKAVSVGEAIRGLEVVSVAFDVVRFPITILVPQQRQISGFLLSDNDIVIGKNEQSARMLEPYDKCRGREALHDPRRLSCIWNEQRSAWRDWGAFWRRGGLWAHKKAAPQLLIGIAGGIWSDLLSGATLLSST